MCAGGVPHLLPFFLKPSLCGVQPESSSDMKYYKSSTIKIVLDAPLLQEEKQCRIVHVFNRQLIIHKAFEWKHIPLSNSCYSFFRFIMLSHWSFQCFVHKWEFVVIAWFSRKMIEGAVKWVRRDQNCLLGTAIQLFTQKACFLIFSKWCKHQAMYLL